MRVDKKLNYERLMILFGATVSFVGFIISITIEDFSEAFLPYFNVIVPIVNITSAVMCLFLFIFPKFRIMQSIVVFGQEMVNICKCFGVQSIEVLLLLLQQYEIN